MLLPGSHTLKNAARGQNICIAIPLSDDLHPDR
jgi:hypothetical protein